MHFQCLRGKAHLKYFNSFQVLPIVCLTKTMKAILISLLLLGTATANAQNWNEWFNQKETKTKYLLKQIAGLKIYLDYAEKGYNIANHGLQTIHSIKKGDFNLHNDFFNSLKQVNPSIQNWSRVADIIAMQIKIVKQIKSVLSSINRDAQFTSNEIDYCKAVFERLSEDCLEDINELMIVTTARKLEMKDDERIKRIEKIFLDMQDKYAFVSSFGNEMKVLSVQRLNEKKEINFSKEFSK